MNCSVKFLSPSVTAGLPLPGCDPPDDEPLDVELLLLFDEPQAASASARATAMRAARPRVQVRMVTRGSSSGDVDGGGGGVGRLGLDGGVVDGGAQSARRHETLQDGEERVDRERQD